MRLAWLPIVVFAAVAACGGRPRSQPAPVPTIPTSEAADPYGAAGDGEMCLEPEPDEPEPEPCE